MARRSVADAGPYASTPPGSGAGGAVSERPPDVFANVVGAVGGGFSSALVGTDPVLVSVDRTG